MSKKLTKELTKTYLPTICLMAYMESAITYNPGLTNNKNANMREPKYFKICFVHELDFYNF